jgi:hypothetical protein
MAYGALPALPALLPVRSWFVILSLLFCIIAGIIYLLVWSAYKFLLAKEVKVPPALVTFGFVAFMTTMAGGRFIGDRLSTKLGKIKKIERYDLMRQMSDVRCQK